MIAVLQRVSAGACHVEQETTGEIGTGLLVLLGVAEGDTVQDAERLAGKIARCRIFPDAAGKLGLSLKDAGGAALVISNFTLLADYAHGNRPSYFAAAPEQAEALYGSFTELLRAEGVRVETGRFGAHMHLSIEADGPVTLVMDSKKLLPKGSCHEAAH